MNTNLKFKFDMGWRGDPRSPDITIVTKPTSDCTYVCGECFYDTSIKVTEMSHLITPYIEETTDIIKFLNTDRVRESFAKSTSSVDIQMKCPNCGKVTTLISLDSNIAVYIKELNDLGVKTDYCCGGHPNKKDDTMDVSMLFDDMYISIDTAECCDRVRECLIQIANLRLLRITNPDVGVDESKILKNRLVIRVDRDELDGIVNSPIVKGKENMILPIVSEIIRCDLENIIQAAKESYLHLAERQIGGDVEDEN